MEIYIPFLSSMYTAYIKYVIFNNVVVGGGVIILQCISLCITMCLIWTYNIMSCDASAIVSTFIDYSMSIGTRVGFTALSVS